jgi:hypothetical protein
MATKPVYILGTVTKEIIEPASQTVMITVDGKDVRLPKGLTDLTSFKGKEVEILAKKEPSANYAATGKARPAGLRATKFEVKDAPASVQPDPVPTPSVSVFFRKMDIREHVSELFHKDAHMKAIGLRSCGREERARLEKNYDIALADLAVLLYDVYINDLDFHALVDDRKGKVTPNFSRL